MRFDENVRHSVTDTSDSFCLLTFGDDDSSYFYDVNLPKGEFAHERGNKKNLFFRHLVMGNRLTKTNADTETSYK